PSGRRARQRVPAAASGGRARRVDVASRARRNMIRAVAHPYPGAFVGDGPHRLFLWGGTVLPGEGSGAAPGTLLAILPSRGVQVATGEGALLLTRVQRAGAAEEPAEAWAERRALRAGARVTEGAG